jgi:hypothetical protein
VLKNGEEVKLQRNALSVLEPPTGKEDDGDCDNSFCSSSDRGDKDMDYSMFGFWTIRILFFLITYMHPLFYIHEVRLLWLSTVKVVCNVF